jgi:hypothetical protein
MRECQDLPLADRQFTALLDEWSLVGVPFLLLGIAALLGGVALLYRPELPQRLVAWLTKRDDLPLTAAR